jgi:hypothetical protein
MPRLSLWQAVADIKAPARRTTPHGWQKETTMIGYLIATLAMLLAFAMVVVQATRSMGVDFEGY